ncbi:uncharacterized protein M437DRAFT_78327 [Aureobasidium melanogenum CBS 110374]|uniref:BTB domain-containing protein n=1 Tax=Aureobasidium melanogenum (strain CBS 110374) TaxID=1043003 RepID=A0A074VEM9_AURM1|nr:uncharacterized protein M437DRAFT_78327 [Aureobasidium melanogenum CBS 110374]KEQ59185.1 hypothetical protein M437DRAFT_78327 [Aureobasidium melanogenum CBS 110374]
MANNTPAQKRTFFNDEQFPDVIVKFGNQQIFAHKVMLASGSVWFEKALCGSFSVSFATIHEISNASPNAIMAMLKHLYGTTYKKQEIQINDWSYPEFHLTVFMLGDKYDIRSLRKEAAEQFNEFLAGEISDGAFYEETIHAIQKLLGSDAHQLADDSLTTNAQKLVLKHFETFFGDSTFRELLGDGTMLTKDLTHVFLNKIYDKKFSDGS